MTSHPIQFNGEMVRSILDGRKTQTRRLVTVPWDKHSRTLPYEPVCVEDGNRLLVDCSERKNSRGHCDYREITTCVRAPFGQVGDRLWVKETFHFDGNHAPDSYPCVHYAADRAVHDTDCLSVCPERNHYPSDYAGPWTPSVHMPLWASRIALDVTGLRVERLQAITEDGARAEGVDSVAKFRALWDRIAKPGATFGDNPWVWVYEFRRAE